MKYNLTAAVYGWAFSGMLRAYYRKHFPDRDFRPIRKALHREYRAMLERTPGIGGRENSLEADLIGACYFFSMAKAVPGMTPDLMNDIVDAGVHSALMRRLHAGKRRRGELFSQKVQDRKVREAERSRVSPYEMDWRFTYRKGVHAFDCTYTRCGICELAHREHTEAFLPCMCNMDFATYDLLGGRLTRTKTLANGDNCCNFHVEQIL